MAIFQVRRRVRSRRGSRLMVASLVVVSAALIGASVGYAATLNVYANHDLLSAGGYYQTGGWNNRDWNAACRTDNSGQMSVQYFDTNWVERGNSGTAYTNCNTPASVIITTNGYFLSRCNNKGTIQFPVYCETTNGFF